MLAKDARITKEEMMLQIALVVSQRSTCKRLKVGAVITDWDKTTIHSVGYNGAARKIANGCHSDEAGNCGCLHAEENALIKAPYDRGPLIMFCTHMPCRNCAQRILNSQVIRVYYRATYRHHEGIAMLQDHGVACAYQPCVEYTTDA